MHRVQVKAGQSNVELPDGKTYDAGDEAVLTDDQFAKLSPTIFVSVLTDLGTEATAAEDEVFVTEEERLVGLGLGLLGATEASRYVGATSAVPPVLGTFAVGDFVVSQVGTIFVCVVAGSPGTWQDVSSSEVGFGSDAVSRSHVQGAAITAVPGCSVTAYMTARPHMVFASLYFGSATGESIFYPMLYVDGVEAKRVYARTPTTAGRYTLVTPNWRVAPLAAGTHTLDLRFGSFSTGVTIIVDGPSVPTTFSVLRV